MVIQIPPPTEPHYSPNPREAEQSSLRESGNGLGVFARILAGLHQRSTSAPAAFAEIAEEVSAETSGIRLAETAELAGAFNPDQAAEKAGESGDMAAGLAPSEFPVVAEIAESEKNVLFSPVVPAEKNAAVTFGGLDPFAESNQAGSGLAEGLHPAQTAVDTPLKAGNAETAGQNAALYAESAHRYETLASNSIGAARDTAINTAAGTATNTASANETAALQTASGAAATDVGMAAGMAAATATASGTAARQSAAETRGSGEERAGRLDELRRERRHGLTAEVRDFRSQTVSAEAAARENALSYAGAEGRSASTGREVTLELQLSGQGREAASAPVTSWESGPGSSGSIFENLLARELRQNFNGDIVRHASFLLRDGNEGTIRLVLKPESLGNVKIHLEMAENKIIGHIVVETEEAMRAFEKEITSLEKAFEDTGFEGASLEMSLASDSGENQRQEAEAILPGHFSASRYDAEIERDQQPAVFNIFQPDMQAVSIMA